MFFIAVVLAVIMSVFLVEWAYIKWAQNQFVEEDIDNAFDRLKTSQNQVELGEELFGMLNAAAVLNTQFALKDGVVDPNLGRILVEKRPRNGENYSVFVSTPYKTCFTSCGTGTCDVHNIFQVDLCLDKKDREIHINKGPYGPERYWPLAKLELIYEHLRLYVLKYNHYAENPDDMFRTIENVAV